MNPLGPRSTGSDRTALNGFGSAPTPVRCNSRLSRALSCDAVVTKQPAMTRLPERSCRVSTVRRRLALHSHHQGCLSVAREYELALVRLQACPIGVVDTDCRQI
jgi:hypothetical protein